MTPAKDNSQLVRDALDAFDNLNGPQPGFRPAHAKGILLSGVFTPSRAASSISRAPHLQNNGTPVTVRFSDFAGVPAVPDNDPNASPRGIAIRFHLAEHLHTDIIGHSVDGFPVRTADEFVEFLRAAYQSAASTAKPSPIEIFLASHPAALEFIQAPKPMPASFATECYYAVNAYRFIRRDGTVRYGRYRVRPAAGAQHLDAAAAAAVSRDFLFDEIRARLANGPVSLQVAVQIAGEGDTVDDSTVHWPNDRPEVELGTVELTRAVANDAGEQRHIIFDPIPRVDGIEPSGDPLLEPRADVYLASGRRRRAQGVRAGAAS